MGLMRMRSKLVLAILFGSTFKLVNQRAKSREGLMYGSTSFGTSPDETSRGFHIELTVCGETASEVIPRAFSITLDVQQKITHFVEHPGIRWPLTKQLRVNLKRLIDWQICILSELKACSLHKQKLWARLPL